MDLLDFFRGKIPPRKVLRLIGVLPDTGVFAAMVTADPPRGGGEPEVWRRYYGWGTDRRIAHTAVSVHLQKKEDRKQWDKALPEASKKNERTGSLASFAPGR